MGHKRKRPSFETPRKRAAPQDDVNTCGSAEGAQRFQKNLFHPDSQDATFSRLVF
jgi:hypothetical protein